MGWKCEKNPAPTFFAGGATKHETSKQHLVPPIFLDIVYWTRVHEGAGRAAGRNFGGLHTFLSSTLKRLQDRSFFSLWPTDSPCIFRKRRRSLVGRCGCGKSKGVWGEMSRWECFPSFHLLKGQRAVRGFEGGGGEK